MMLTPEQAAGALRSLHQYSRIMFRARKGMDMIENWHQVEVCRALHRVVTGKSTRLIINIPPRSGKTELAVKNFISWGTGLFPDSEWIHASYSKRLATANTYEVRAIMNTPEYKQIFPWLSLQDDSKARDEFRTEQGGVIYATGADGTITGYGASKKREKFGGAIIIDDPHKAAEATSSVQRQNVIDWYQSTIASRLNKEDGPIIVIMQRLHEEDLTGWLLGGGTGEKWDHISIPARMANGESFWPSQFSNEMLDRLEASNSYIFAGQYQQRPSPLGGGLFKESWWRFLDVAPPIEWRAIYADTAQKTKEQNDFSVFQCWGRSISGQAVLLDMVKGKWEAPELEAIARSFWKKHKSISGMGTLRAFKVEDKVSGTGLIQTLKREGIPMIGVQRNVDKVVRAFDVAPMIESGNVVLVNDVAFLTDLISEASVFPNGAFDDMIDATMTAISDILLNDKQPSLRSL